MNTDRMRKVLVRRLPQKVSFTELELIEDWQLPNRWLERTLWGQKKSGRVAIKTWEDYQNWMHVFEVRHQEES